jgi:hypothetical protein
VATRHRYRLRTVTIGGIAARSTRLHKARRAARPAANNTAWEHSEWSADTRRRLRRSSKTAADTATREIFRGIATDRGKLAFNGKMIVA